VSGDTYQWQVSVTGTNHTDFVDIAAANGETFQPPALNNTTHFRRIYNNTCGTESNPSNILTVTVHQPPAVPTAAAVSPNTACAPTPPNGSLTIAEQTGVSYAIVRLANDTTAFATSRTFNGLVQGLYTMLVRDANQCINGDTVRIISGSGAPDLAGLWPNDSICNPHIGNIVLAPPLTGYGTLPTIVWRANGTEIPGQTSLTLTTAPPTATTIYTIEITNTQTNCDASFSKTVHVISPPQITTQPTGGSICMGQTPPIQLSVAATSTLTLSYQWERSPDNVPANFTAINLANAATYSVPNTPASADWYRLRINTQRDICPPIHSNAVQVNVLTAPTITSATAGMSNERCSTGVVDLTATASAGATIHWFENATGGASVGTGTTFYTPSIANTTSYWAEANNGACTSAARVEAVATIHTVPEQVTVDGTTPACESTILTATGGIGGTIFWQNTTDNGESTTTASVSQSVTANGTYYFRARSAVGQGECWGEQGSITVTINHAPTGTLTVEGDSPACGSTILTAITTEVTGGTGGFTVFWQGTTSNGTDATLGTSPQTVNTEGTNTYYFRARSNTGECWGPQGSRSITIDAPTVITIHPSTTNQSIDNNWCDNSFNQLSVTASGTGTLTYQWFSNTTASNSGGTPISGATSSTFFPPITKVGVQVWYYVVVNATCGPYTSYHSGGHTITLRPPFVPANYGCNSATPGWGSGGLAQITWGNATNTNIESGTTTIQGTDGRPNQIWSGAVQAGGCRKGNATNNNQFNGGIAGNFNADCRQSLHAFNNGGISLQGHYFSWCAVMRFADQLCPPGDGWRVPTCRDFVELDLNLGGNGQDRWNETGDQLDRYTAATGDAFDPQFGGTWGGARWTGYADAIHAPWSTYISSTERIGRTTGEFHGFEYDPSFTTMRLAKRKNDGHTLRCVRNP